MQLAHQKEIDHYLAKETVIRNNNEHLRVKYKAEINELKKQLEISNNTTDKDELKLKIVDIEKKISELHEKTPQQIQAIYENGNNLLLAASAGSGKTFVMVERILDRISRGVRLTELFISTFTNLATIELKERLENVLRKKLLLAESIDEKQIFRQALNDLPNADIMTMDSFTGRIIREYYYYIDIDPNYRLLNDKTEVVNLKQEVFLDLENDILSEKSMIVSKEGFEQLIRNFSNDRNDNGFFDTLIKIHDFAESTPNPLEWLENDMLSGYQKYQSFSDMPNNFLEDFSNSLTTFSQYIQKLITDGLIVWGKKDHEAKLAILTKRLDDYNQISKEILQDNENSLTVLEKFAPISISEGRQRLLTISQIKDDTAKVKFTEYKNQVNKTLEKINNVYKHSLFIEKFTNTFETLTKNLQKVSILFYKNYLSKKLSKSLLEYADINHFAICLLKNNSDILEKYKMKYVEIMVDEYQDTNHMQDTLLNLLSDGKNRFMVGDVKQSIYGFRLADPNLFIEKQKQYKKNENGNLIRLKENFRSRQEILNFTNAIFEPLFDDSLTNMFYDEDEKLKFGNLALPNEVSQENYPELLIYQNDRSKSSGESDDEIDFGEIEIVATRILKLIQDDAKLSEIAILVRNRSLNAEIEEILSTHGIPVVLLDGKVNYLQSIEVKVMLSALRAINNPYNDIDLVSLMRSPMFQFNEDELLKIRLQDKSARFFDAMVKSNNLTSANCHLIDKKLTSKISDFMDYLNDWRGFRVSHSIYELILKIYQEKYYVDYVGGLSNGAQRQANLHALLTRAKSFEKNGYKGLFQFIQFIDTYLKQSNDLEEAPIEKKESAVKVLTIHKSKGLEFPYVFVVGLGKKINRIDLNQNVIITRDCGVTVKAIVPYHQTLISMETIPYTVSKSIKEKSLISEEMRLLYVAMTRAEKQLFLSATISSAKSTKQKNDDFFGSADSNAFSSWIGKIDKSTGLLADSLRISDKFINWIGGVIWSKMSPSGNFFVSDEVGVKVLIYTDSDIAPVSEQAKGSVSFNIFDKLTKPFEDEQKWLDMSRKAKEILDSSNAYNEENKNIIEMATIQTPSAIKKRYEVLFDEIVKTNQDYKDFELEFKVPTFGNTKMDGADYGSLTHEILQRIDFNCSNIEQEIEKSTADSLQNNSGYSISIIDDIKDKIIKLFTDNSLGIKIREAGKKGNLFREQPFSMLVDSKIINDLDFSGNIYSEESDHVLIKGVIDGYIDNNSNVILFDYKTDRNVSRETLIKKYKKQLEVYSKALSESKNNLQKIETYIIALGLPEIEIIEIGNE